MDNGVEKVVSAPGTAATVISVNVADGSKSAYKFFGGNFNFQDIEPKFTGGAVTGFGVTGLQTGVTIPSGTGGCISASGCGVIRGHVSELSADLQSISWSKTFNDFTGGTGAYAGLTSL